MAWTTPTTRATGDLITAAIWNTDLVNDSKYLHGDAGDIAYASGGGLQTTQTSNNLVLQNLLAGGDANPAFKLFGGGAMIWGAGGGTAADLEIARISASGNAYLQLVNGEGFGYGTGTGGTVTQNTSKVTGVTINKPVGKITTAADNINTSVATEFTVTNNCVGAPDTIILNIGTAVAGAYLLQVSAVSNGSFRIKIHNPSWSSAQAEAIPINFAVIKGAQA